MDKLIAQSDRKEGNAALIAICSKVQELIDLSNSNIDAEKRLKIEHCEWNGTRLCFWPISCVTKEGMDGLCKQLTNIAFQQQSRSIWKELADLMIPTTWEEKVTDLVKSLSIEVPVVPTNSFDSWLLENITGLTMGGCDGIRSQLEASGFILNFRNQLDLVIVRPQWMADMFKTVLSFKHEVKNANLSKKQLCQRWAQVLLFDI